VNQEETKGVIVMTHARSFAGPVQVADLLCRALLLACALGAASGRLADAVDPKYIVVRLDEVRLVDDGDGAHEGEIQYLSVAATGDRGRAPISTQQVGFPVENWYEAADDGANATFMGGHDRAIPLFAFPEAEMGDELVLVVAVADDDETSDAVVIGHAVAAKIGVAVAGFFTGPAGSKAVDALSGAVQKEIEKGGDRDSLGTLTVTFTKAALDGSTFGLPAGQHDAAFETRAGNVWFKYSLHRVADRPAVSGWCASVTLDGIKIVDDSDDGTQGMGDVYVRTRVADGFAVSQLVDGASQLDQKVGSLPRNSYTRDVDTGHEFLRGNERGMTLYSNTRGQGRAAHCTGLPVMLYVEVDAFEDDSQADCSGRTCDDVLGVLPLLYTQAWMRDHPGSHAIVEDVHGASGKARVSLTLNIWDPNADPDQALAGTR
jgi:hypothetical protein